METNEIIKSRIEIVLPMLNERQRRIYLAAEAQSIGWGGKTKISKLTSVTRHTIAKGISDKNADNVLNSRIRKAGGGRKKLIDHQPDMLKAIENIVSPHTMGNPMNPLIWTSKSIRKITSELLALEYKVCHEDVRQCLIDLGYSLQVNKKTKEGGNSPDRNRQFEHINETSKEFIKSNDSVISVDCKKKELVGEYKNNGHEWAPVKNPIEVNVYDLLTRLMGKPILTVYMIYKIIVVGLMLE